MLGKALGGGLIPVSLFLARRELMGVFRLGTVMSNSTAEEGNLDPRNWDTSERAESKCSQSQPSR